MSWNTLEIPWQVCFEQAWAALMAGSLPIGAVITSPDGVVVAQGRNKIAEGVNDLAHAEVTTLLQFDFTLHDPPHGYTLWTTMEPCPMCLGMFYMSGLRTLRFAARDPYAGSVDLLGKTPYLARKPIQVFPPEDPLLESIQIALFAVREFTERPSGGFVVDLFAKNDATAVALGRKLAHQDAIAAWQNDHLSAAQAYTLLAETLVGR